MADLHGRVVLVTGAATGIGEAVAETLYREGTRLALVGHDPAGLNQVAKRLDSSGERVMTLAFDVRDEPEGANVAGAPRDRMHVIRPHGDDARRRLDQGRSGVS